LFQKGMTNGVFQFESPGMKKHLRALKPDKFEDIIAMNALYRPGPMEYIPNYIARKHGKEKIAYDIPIMEEKLKETKSTLEKLNNPKELERFAREKKMFKKDDEDIFVITQD